MFPVLGAQAGVEAQVTPGIKDRAARGGVEAQPITLLREGRTTLGRVLRAVRAVRVVQETPEVRAVQGQVQRCFA